MNWNLANRISLAAGTLVVLGLGSCQPIQQATQSIEESFTPRSYGRPPLTLKDEPDLRVRIVKDSSRVTIDGPTRVVVRTDRGPAPVSLECPVVITSSSRGLTIRDGKGALKTWGYGTDLELVPSDARTNIGNASIAGTSPLRVDEVAFPGFISIRPRWQDYPQQFDVIASMGLESYLPGAVSREMGGVWPRQALQAQAIVTRTLALSELQKSKASGRQYDVESSLDLQRATTGTGMTSTMEAVRQTSGMALTSGGRLITAYFCSTCGGRPASAIDVWGASFTPDHNGIEPLKARARDSACDLSPDFRWEVQRRDDELSNRIRAWGVAYTSAVSSMTRLREVRVEQMNAAKRPTKYRLIDNGGREFVVTADELRAACNQDVRGYPAVDDSTRVRSGDFEVEVWANLVKIRGRGFGHGVGMCQQCAKGFADQGWDWRRMMAQFYPTADLTKMY